MREFLTITSWQIHDHWRASISMRKLTEAELVNMGIHADQSPMIFFQGKCFHRGPSFSLKNRAIGISYCQREESRGYNFLLVENKTSVTVWKEEQAVVVVDSQLQVKRQHLLDNCRQELMKCIGPMASLIIDELTPEADSLEAEQFIKLIAEQIPDAKLAQEFTENMTSAL
jgi:hypothetical protein